MTYRSHVLPVLTALFVVAVLAASGVVAWRALGPYPSGKFAELDEVDATMLRQLSAQFDAAATRPDAVWTNEWRFDERPLVLLRTSGDKASQWTHAFLVNMSAHVDTRGMRPVDDSDLPRLGDVVVSRTYGLGDLDKHLPANFTFEDVAGQPVLVMKYHDALLRGEAPSIAYDFPTFLVHEEFHTSAQRAWTYPEGEAPYIDGYPTSDEHLDLLRAELAVLDAAGAESSPARLAELARDLVALRLERERRWPQLVPQNSLEKMEGTATYVERAAARIRGEAAEPTSMVAALDQLREQGALGGLDRDVFYDSGARLGVVLDVLAPGWKARMADEGATPFSVLAEATGLDSPPDASELAGIVARHVEP
jgi:hypothetical protein